MKKRSKGLGDTINKITKASGIDKIVKKTAEAVGIKDCGCSSRRDTLNRLFPYENK